jgi:L-cystine uptake protein TcyP (sodium:dicarboxylate symporter family)
VSQSSLSETLVHFLDENPVIDGEAILQRRSILVVAFDHLVGVGSGTR